MFLHHLFRSLKHPNFRIYYIGQVISLNGTWMQNVAQAWLIYRLTESSFMLGLIGFCALLPVLVFGLYGGLVTDFFDRRRLLIACQCIAMVQSVVFATLVLSGVIQPWHIVMLAFALGLTNAFEIPARHALLSELVPARDLPNAIALNSSAFNSARFIGPALAGLIVVWAGEGVVLLINSVSYFGVLIALYALHLPAQRRRVDSRSNVTKIAEGLVYSWREIKVRAGLMLVGIASMVGISVTTLMPVFTRETFAGESDLLGVLLGSVGLGALIGALRLAHRNSTQGLEQIMGFAGVITSCALLLFSWTHNIVLALVLLFAIGFFQTTLVASTNTMIQSLVNDHLRGRVMAIFSTVFIGFMPIGSLIIGTTAHFLGAPMTVRLFALVGIVSSVLFLLFRGWRDVGYDSAL